MRTVLSCVSATCMLAALTGCVELNRRSGTRASMSPTAGFEVVPGHTAYVGSGDAFHPVGPVEPSRLSMRAEGLIVSVGFDPDRSGPTFIGPVLPLLPMRLRPQRVTPGTPLYMSVQVISPDGPVKLDLSAVRVRLPDGQVIFPVCDTKPVTNMSGCVVRTSPLTGTGRHSTFVTLPFPVDGYHHPSLEIELPVVEVGGRRIILPRITATHITKWLLQLARA
jgi:hypothetical protein